MARETKEQRDARRELENAAFEAEQAAMYPARLMALLERATCYSYELVVRNKQFVLKDLDDAQYVGPFYLDLNYSKLSQESLNDLDWRVSVKEKAYLEHLRRQELRAAALNKLTPEERRLLDL